MKTNAKKTQPALSVAEQAKKRGVSLSANQQQFLAVALEQGAQLEPAGVLAGVGR